jgi:hypothetical protein
MANGCFASWTAALFSAIFLSSLSFEYQRLRGLAFQISAAASNGRSTEADDDASLALTLAEK